MVDRIPYLHNTTDMLTGYCVYRRLNEGLLLLMPSTTTTELPSSVVTHLQQRICRFIMSRKKSSQKQHHCLAKFTINVNLKTIPVPRLRLPPALEEGEVGGVCRGDEGVWTRGEGGGGVLPPFVYF